MIWLTIGLVVAVLFLAVTLARPRKPEPSLDPETALKAAVELYRIRRQLDVAYTKSEQRRDAHQLRRELDSELRRADSLESLEDSNG